MNVYIRVAGRRLRKVQVRPCAAGAERRQRAYSLNGVVVCSMNAIGDGMEDGMEDVDDGVEHGELAGGGITDLEDAMEHADGKDGKRKKVGFFKKHTHDDITQKTPEVLSTRDSSALNSVDNEFGKLEADVLHLKEHQDIHADSTTGEKIKAIFLRKRHMQQFFSKGKLFRERKKRKISNDELFLDLLIVANIAQFGHELRESFDGWPSLQKFFLLFQVVWFIWLEFAQLLNLFGTYPDITAKAYLSLFMMVLVSIGMSAHTAFTSTIIWTALSVVLVILVASFGRIFSGGTSSRINSKSPLKNTVVMGGIAGVVSAVPYMVAAILNNEENVQICYWAGFGMSVLRLITPRYARLLSLHYGQTTYPAINIEALAEKFGLITLITIGETFLSLLSTSGVVVRSERTASILGTGALSLIISYGLMSFYFEIDEHICKGGRHALRRGSIYAMTWIFTHLFYQAALVTGATAVGECLQIAALQEYSGSEHSIIVRAEASEPETDLIQFDSKWRWLLGGSYGIAVLLSGFIGYMNSEGPLAITRKVRLPVRTVIVIAAMFVAIPLAETLSALGAVGIIAAVIGFLSFFELFLVQCDRYQIWGWIDYDSLSKRSADTDTRSKSSTSIGTSDNIFKSTEFTETNRKQCRQG